MANQQFNLYDMHAPMFEPAEIDLLKSQLPRNYLRYLTEKTGLSSATINRFFNYYQIKLHNAEAIYDASLEIILEHRQQMELRKIKMRRILAADLAEKKRQDK